MISSSTPILVITGPTACGKTRRAVQVAEAFGGEIISADSRQVYRGMDLGTGKDLDDYGLTPYHLIDIAPAGSKYNLYQFLADCKEAEASIRSRSRLPIVCGGTGMYIEALLNNLSLPEVPVNDELRASLQGKSLQELTAILATMKTLHNTTDVDTVKRAIRAIEIQTYYREHPDQAVTATPRRRDDFVIVALDIPREERRRLITARLNDRLEHGMVDEVRHLLDSGIEPDDLIYYGLEYKYLTLHIIGRLSFDEMRHQLEIAIHQFAKRQMTWFRGMERRGFTLHWIPWDIAPEEFIASTAKLLGL